MSWDHDPIKVRRCKLQSVTKVSGSTLFSVTRGWVGVKFPGKKRYVTLEWPSLNAAMAILRFSLKITLLCHHVILFYLLKMEK